MQIRTYHVNYAYFVTGCDVGKIDCVFVLDVSVSIKNDTNFGLIRNLVTQVASFMSIDIDHALFSVMLFARHAWISFTIPEYTNIADLINAVNNISYFDVSKLNRTGTNIPEALNLLTDASQDGRLGLRSDANYRHAIFVTDGRPNTKDLVEKELGRRLNNRERQQLRKEDEKNSILAAKRLHDSGIFNDISVIGIKGIQKINFEELRHIASRPELIYGFTESEFLAVQKQLYGEICKRK